ncbi:MAG: UTP--glucose-1-phosphate uridylyltransferase, partial [Candidatus Omnitrophota bacterium]
MARKRLPIVMITTTKTVIDKKGGQLGLQTYGDTGVSKPQIMELAQAKSAGQGELFGELGLRGGDNRTLFNTNIALINYSVLQPFARALRGIIGDKLFGQIVTPDLIKNTKEQGGKEFIQLEGAMASALLNFNGFIATLDINEEITREQREAIKELMREHGIERLLYIVNISAQDRNKFFTPVKFAWDYWYFAYTNHFKVNPNTYRLDNLRPGHLAAFDLSKEYEQVHVLLDTFGGGYVDTLEMDSLTVKGRVSLKDGEERIRLIEDVELVEEDKSSSSVYAIISLSVLATFIIFKLLTKSKVWRRYIGTNFAISKIVAAEKFKMEYPAIYYKREYHYEINVIGGAINKILLYGEDAIPGIVTYLYNGDWIERQVILGVLGGAIDPAGKGINFFRSGLNSRNAYIRYQARRGLELLASFRNGFGYPASVPVSSKPDRSPTKEERQIIIKAFGGQKVLKENFVMLKRNVVISPSLRTPAEVRSEMLFVNPNILRGPPEQLKVIFEGHELAHLLGFNERDARVFTFNYLLDKKLFEKHVEFLKSNSIGLVGNSDWIEYLTKALRNFKSISKEIVRIKGEFDDFPNPAIWNILDEIFRVIVSIFPEVIVNNRSALLHGLKHLENSLALIFGFFRNNKKVKWSIFDYEVIVYSSFLHQLNIDEIFNILEKRGCYIGEIESFKQVLKRIDDVLPWLLMAEKDKDFSDFAIDYFSDKEDPFLEELLLCIAHKGLLLGLHGREFVSDLSGNSILDEINRMIADDRGSSPLSEKVTEYIDGLAEYDRAYLEALRAKSLQEAQTLKIGENFIPSANISERDQERELGVVNYEDIETDSANAEAAKEAILLGNPMDGGLGSSLGRVEYLRRVWEEVGRKGKKPESND